MIQYAWLVPFISFLGLPLCLFFGKRTWEKGGSIAIVLIGISLILSILAGMEAIEGKKLLIEINWMGLVGFSGIYVDRIAGLMLIAVSWVSFLIVMFSLGYMHEDTGRPRYYALVCLFIGAMQLFVISLDMVTMFVAWEIMGFCSYALIGFWYERMPAMRGSLKAFLTTRIGDIFLLAAMLLIYLNLGTLNIVKINSSPAQLGRSLVTMISIFMLIGAIGKSSQIPLWGWLWEAMEGPTTVSALIHAATMVNAGVYLMARMFPFVSSSNTALLATSYVGGLTAFLAATLAFTEYDIKRVLAYSTISQLGYMLLAVGLGGVGRGIFHLLSHSSFKALLFLCSGAVLHATLDTRDMRKLGGLWKPMKLTAIAMLVGSLSLAGIPPFSGFFSKGLVIETAAVNGDMILYLLAVLTSALTAFYIFRMWFMTFFGWREKPPEEFHVHEAPKVMLIPLYALVATTFALSFLGEDVMAQVSSAMGYLSSKYSEGVVEIGRVVALVSRVHIPEPLIEPITLTLAVTGLALATYMYYISRPPDLTRTFLFKLLDEKYGTDIFYYGLATLFREYVSPFMIWFDRKVVDGVVNAIGKGFLVLGDYMRRIHTGVVQDYIEILVLGIVLLLLLMLL